MNQQILLAGQAGDGIQTVLNGLVKLIKHKHWYMHAYKDYMSRIRGGESFVGIRISDTPIASHTDVIDIILCLDHLVLDNHIHNLVDGAIVITRPNAPQDLSRFNVIELDPNAITKQTLNPKVAPTAGIGVLAHLFGLDANAYSIIKNPRWPEPIQNANALSFELGYTLMASKNQQNPVIKLSDRLNQPVETKLLYLNANQSMALGALAAGIDFYSAYPMAPSTGIMNALASYESEMKIVVEQAEDEIAAINSIIGAAGSGARAMTGTSGGGMALMVEAIGLAGVAEVPIVIANVQRPGPATGLPTRTEQSDLLFSVYGSPGEFPKAVLSVTSVENAFYQTFRAFNIADRYRIPVILLSDQYLADSTTALPSFDLDALTIDRNIDSDESTIDYQHYDPNQVIYKRRLPGGHTLIMNDSHEHETDGHITESAITRNKMNVKRLQKLEALSQEMIEPDYVGPEHPDCLLIGWGSVGAMLSAVVNRLNEQKSVDQIKSVGALIFSDVYPLPTQRLQHYTQQASLSICIEQNQMGQLAKLIRAESGIQIDYQIHKSDGRQMSEEWIINQVKELIL